LGFSYKAHNASTYKFSKSAISASIKQPHPKFQQNVTIPASGVKGGAKWKGEGGVEGEVTGEVR